MRKLDLKIWKWWPKCKAEVEKDQIIFMPCRILKKWKSEAFLQLYTVSYQSCCWHSRSSHSNGQAKNNHSLFLWLQLSLINSRIVCELNYVSPHFLCVVLLVNLAFLFLASSVRFIHLVSFPAGSKRGVNLSSTESGCSIENDKRARNKDVDDVVKGGSNVLEKDV